MSDVINLEDSKPHETRKVECIECQHVWIAVFPIGAKNLECPGCHEMQLIQTYGAEIIGPFPGGEFKISSHGFLLPHVRAFRREASWCLRLDERFEVDTTPEEIYRWAWFLGNTMAVSAGYTCLGEDSKPRNLFSCRIGDLEIDE